MIEFRDPPPKKARSTDSTRVGAFRPFEPRKLSAILNARMGVEDSLKIPGEDKRIAEILFRWMLGEDCLEELEKE